MKKDKEPKTIYFSDELNDDFAGNGIEANKVDNNFRYTNKSLLFRFNSFLLRYFFAVPVLWLVNTLLFRPKIMNKGVLKQLKKKGYYVYSNHVLPFDPIILPIKTQPGKAMVIIAGHELFSINKFVTWLVSHFYAIPTPNMDIEMTENFKECLSYHINKRHRVLIYPEAHIWPYYNGIRPFRSASFRYPVDENVPIVVATTTFKKRRGNRKPKPIIYLDGPFYSNSDLSYHDQINELRNKAYETMLWRAGKEDNYAYIKYIKVDKK